jgi:hypothetical protein
MKNAELIDLRHKLAPAHYRAIRQFSAGRDMTLRRIARTGAAYVSDLPRMCRLMDPEAGHWVTRRLREIEIQVTLAKYIARRKEAATAAKTTRKLSALTMQRIAQRTLAPPQRG